MVEHPASARDDGTSIRHGRAVMTHRPHGSRSAGCYTSIAGFS
ncbi:hypothetical protein [Azospirillum melinis]